MSDAPHDNHGSTPAAWTLVTLVMIGFLVGSIAVVLANQALVLVGVGIVVLGLVVGKVMQMMASDPQAEKAEEKTGSSAAG